MEFHPDIAPAMRAPTNSKERQSERNLVQAALMNRSPLDEMEWVLRYAKAFGDQFDTDEEFYELVRGAHNTDDLAEKNRLLTRLQEILDESADQRAA